MRNYLPVLLLLCAATLVAGESMVLRQLRTSTGLPAGVIDRLAPSFAEAADGCGVASEKFKGMRAALAVVPVVKRKDAKLRGTLRERAQRRAVGEAIRMLVVDELQEQAERFFARPADQEKAFLFHDAVVVAVNQDGRAAWLATARLGPGMQQALAATDERVAALVWIDAASLELFRRALPTAVDLKPAYARELAELARKSMAGKDYADALGRFGNAIKHGATAPDIRMDAVRCSMFLDQKEVAQAVAVNIWQTQQGELDTNGAEEVGDLLLQLGKRELAAEAFQRAIDLALQE